MAIASEVLQIVLGHVMLGNPVRQILLQFSLIWVDVDHSHANVPQMLSIAGEIRGHSLDMEN